MGCRGAGGERVVAKGTMSQRVTGKSSWRGFSANKNQRGKGAAFKAFWKMWLLAGMLHCTMQCCCLRRER